MLELDDVKLQALLEAVLLAAGKPLTEDDLLGIFVEGERPSKGSLREALRRLQARCEDRGIQLIEIASGYQFQVKPEWASWVVKLWEEKAPRYSRALLETLALIAYRQPITRGEIEDIRGVSLSPSIFKTLLEEREWIRVVGHREVPGRPALYATTKAFLDYFGLKNLEALPSLPEIMSLEALSVSLEETPFVQQTLPLEDAEDIEVVDAEIVDIEIDAEVVDVEAVDAEVDSEAVDAEVNAEVDARVVDVEVDAEVVE